jgi:hypothetical protein
LANFSGVHPKRSKDTQCVLLLADIVGSYEWVSIPCNLEIKNVALVCQKEKQHQQVHSHPNVTTIRLSGLAFAKINSLMNIQA